MTSSPTAPTLAGPQDDVAHDDAVDRDGGSSAAFLRSVGRMIRALRVRAGLTQAELGERIGYGEEMISKVERGNRIPRPEFIDNAERVLDTHGVLAAMKDELSRASYAGILGKVVQEEAQALAIHCYDTHVLNALLQTEDYMRALFSMQTPSLSAREVDRQVTARLGRQQVVHRDRAPVMSFVMDEALLRRPYGGADVLRGQLHHLIELGRLPHLDLQVMPLDQEHTPGSPGALHPDGHPQAHPQRLRRSTGHARPHGTRPGPDLDATYSRIRAQALSPKDTLHFMKELWADLG